MENHLPETTTEKSTEAKEASADDRSRQITSRANDPFFAGISTYTGDAPSDLSVNHDEYLYGDLA